jgi:hypothetical protein
MFINNCEVHSSLYTPSFFAFLSLSFLIFNDNVGASIDFDAVLDREEEGEVFNKSKKLLLQIVSIAKINNVHSNIRSILFDGNSQ